MREKLLEKIVKGVIFDVDGVILDSMGIWDEIGSKFLDEKKIAHDKNLDEKLKTMTMPEAIIYLKNKFERELFGVDIISEIKDKIIKKYYEREVSLKSGVIDFLELLKRNRVKICAATANNYEIVKNVFERLGIKKYFLEIFSCEEIGCDKRESAKIFEVALDFFGLEKKNVIVFEDSLHAIKNVIKEDFFTVGIFDRYEKKNWHEIKKIASVCFNDFCDVYNFFLEKVF